MRAVEKSAAFLIYQEMYDTLVKQLAEQENITEHFKATDMLTWVQAMNIISSKAREVANNKMIYIQ